MQSMINSLYIFLGIIITLAIIPSQAADRDPTPNENSIKSSSNQAGPINPHQPKEEVIKRPRIRLSER